MNTPTKEELITYCETYVAGLKKEITNGDGEPWMHTSIKMEEAIIERLKTEGPTPATVSEKAQADPLI